MNFVQPLLPVLKRTMILLLHPESSPRGIRFGETDIEPRPQFGWRQPVSQTAAVTETERSQRVRCSDTLVH